MFKNLFNNKLIKLHIQDKKKEDDSTTLQILNYKVFGFHKAGENDITLFFLLGWHYRHLLSFAYEPHFWNCRMFWNTLFIGYEHEAYIKYPYISGSISLAYFPYHYIELHYHFQFSLKSLFNLYFDTKRSHSEIGFRLFGISIWLSIGRYNGDSDVKNIKRLAWCCDYCKIPCFVQDTHTDKLYKYGEFYKDKGVILYYDKAMTKVVNYSKSRPKKYKDFYLSPRIKIYTLDWLNCLYGRTIEIALPKLYYMAFCFEKPFWNRKWFGFDVDLNCDNNYEKDHIFKVKIILFKFELTFWFDKNSIYRRSNLFSCAAIDRYFQLKGNDKNPKDDYIQSFSYLMYKHKTAQFKHLAKYVSPKKFIRETHHSEYSWKYGFNRATFDTIYALLEKYKTLGEDFDFQELDNKDWNGKEYVVPYAKEKLTTLYEKLKLIRKERRKKK